MYGRRWKGRRDDEVRYPESRCSGGVQRLRDEGEREETAEAEAEERKMVLLTAPLALEGGLAAEHRPPNLLHQVLGLFCNVRLGSDLTRFQLPPLFNMPKSQLQCHGETLYCYDEDYLRKCVRGRNKLDRFASVVAWSISTTRPAIFGQAPYNPILGETHHVSRGHLNVLLEQVSHHPPVTALHATDENLNVELIWCHSPVPKFHGTSIEAVIKGKRQLKLLGFGESYEMDSPNLLIKLIPPTGADWVGNVRIRCKESELEADLCYYNSRGFLGFGGSSRSVRGKIFRSNTSQMMYQIEGEWDRSVKLKDVHSEEVTVLYDAKKAISKLDTPVLVAPQNVWATESSKVWGEVSRAILNKDWARASEAKRRIEEEERKQKRERSANGKVWIPKHFSVHQTSNNNNEWECRPLKPSVPPAPIILPQRY